MPVISDIRLDLKINDILRREGFKGYTRIRPEIKTLVTELLESTESTRLLEPVTSYEIYPVISMESERVLLEGDAAVNGSLVPETFPEAKQLAAIVCTVGPGLEQQVTAYSREGETLRAMLLDGIGSAAVDILAQEACRYFTGEASKRGLQASSPVNPGMPGLPITEQQSLLQLAHAADIGVSLTSSGIMVPRKSTSMIIAVGPGMQTWTQEEICARCNLRETCPYTVLRG